jgi:hypothetical protein
LLKSGSYLEVLGHLADQSLERKLADQQLGGLLVLADLTQSHSSGSVSVGLLHATSSGSGLAGGLGGKLLAGSLASGGLTSGLLGTSHCLVFKNAVVLAGVLMFRLAATK